MEEKKSAFGPSLMSGIYLGVALIAYSLLMFVLDVDRESSVTYISYVVLAGGLFWSVVSFRDKHCNGILDYKGAFSAGFYTGLFASVLTGIFTYIYVQYIDTGLIQEILLKTEEGMLEGNPNMSDDQIDQALYYTEMFTSPVMMGVWGFVMNVIVSAIFSLIIAIFAKRENTEIA
jgi:uncharacterized protein DUF4199